MRGAGQADRIGRRRMRKPEGKRPLARQEVVGRIILKWIGERWGGVL
jgi:hypothetical protein